MTTIDGSQRVVRAERQIAASADQIFELIADPSQQPRWDGNDNLAAAPAGQRVRAIGDVFVMRLSNGQNRENHLTEFDEGRRIAWKPSDPAGHLWRWQLEPIDATHARIMHTYDWSELVDESRMARAQATTTRALTASLDRLAALAEGSEGNLV